MRLFEINQISNQIESERRRCELNFEEWIAWFFVMGYENVSELITEYQEINFKIWKLILVFLSPF